MGRKPKTEQNNKPASVRLDLTGDLKRKFLELKKFYGATTNKSLCHILIAQKYEEVKTEVEHEET